jgi:hypothetical protein
MKTPGCISSEGAGRLILRTTHIHLISTQPVQGKTPADRLSRYPISVDEWCLTIGILIQHRSREEESRQSK